MSMNSAKIKVLDDLFRKIIHKTSDTCITCGKDMRNRRKNAGHFVDREHLSLRWNFNNVHLQCVYCNHHRSKNEMIMLYEEALVEMGIDTAAIKKQRHKIVKISEKAFVEMVVYLYLYIEELGMKPPNGATIMKRNKKIAEDVDDGIIGDEAEELMFFPTNVKMEVL